MELSFVIDAVRRHLWLVVVFVVLGALPGLALRQGASIEFESRAVLIVVPARDARVQINVTGENERYVLGQIAVLQSGALAERVSERLDGEISVPDLLSSLSLDHIPQTDIVEVVVRTTDAERSRTIANAYVDAYVASLSNEVTDEPSPELDRLDALLAEIRTSLSTVDEAIAAAMAPFVAVDVDPDTSGFQQIPTPDQVVPALVSERQILLTEYNQVLTARNELKIGSPLRVATEIIERATTPLGPAGGRGGMLVVAGAMVGGFLGLVAAVALGRVSTRVLSRRHAGELLGIPVLGSASWPTATEHGIPGVSKPFTSLQYELVETLRIRGDTVARPGAPLVIVVAGVERGASVSTLAGALAGRWALDGMATLLVDADLRDPSLARHLAPDRPGIHELVEVRPGANHQVSLDDVATATEIDGLAVIGPGRGRGSFRREEAERLVQSTEGWADVIVIDVGGLMDTSAGLQLAGLADAIVLVVSKKTRATSVEGARRHIERLGALMLPVWSRAGSGRLGRSARRGAGPLPAASTPESNGSQSSSSLPEPSARR